MKDQTDFAKSEESFSERWFSTLRKIRLQFTMCVCRGELGARLSTAANQTLRLTHGEANCAGTFAQPKSAPDPWDKIES
jgi:hypothetical protein